MKRYHRARTFALFLIAVAPLVSVESVSAHCRLDTPNGGETLQIGSKFTIQWTETVAHNVQNWDLYYSTDGTRGPWIPIALDLPPASRSYEWNVQLSPAVASDRVRVRVVQDMLSFSYEDISDRDLSIIPSLTASAPTVSLSSGGAQQMHIDAGSAHAGQTYLILGSSSGTSPGLTLGGTLIPLKVDAYFFTTLTSPNTAPFNATLGTLNASGRGMGQFQLPPGLPAGLAGLVLHHAAIVFDASQAITLATNAIPLTLRR